MNTTKTQRTLRTLKALAPDLPVEHEKLQGAVGLVTVPPCDGFMNVSRYGWPLVRHPARPDETTLACGACSSICITLTVEPCARGTGPGGAFRLGDPHVDVAVCRICGAKAYRS